MSKNNYTVFSPNAHFSGVRNAGRFSTEFENGKAIVDEKTAKLFVNNFGYLCPELFPEHQERVTEIRATTNDVEPEPSAEPEVPGKVKIEFIGNHKIGKTEFTTGAKSYFKEKYAQKLVKAGVAKFTKGTD